MQFINLLYTPIPVSCSRYNHNVRVQHQPQRRKRRVRRTTENITPVQKVKVTLSDRDEAITRRLQESQQQDRSRLLAARGTPGSVYQDDDQQLQEIVVHIRPSNK